MRLLARVEELSGRPVESRPDSSLNVRATLQMARHGAAAHLLKYRATNDPLDYWVSCQAGFALRLFELSVEDRFDLRGTGAAERQAATLVKTGQPLVVADRKLSQVNNLLCCFFVQQRTKSDHHGHDWQDPAFA